MPWEQDIERSGFCVRSSALIDKDAVKRPSVHVQGDIGDGQRVAVNTQNRAAGKYILERLQTDIKSVRGNGTPAGLVVGIRFSNKDGGLSRELLLSSGVLVNLRRRAEGSGSTVGSGVSSGVGSGFGAGVGSGVGSSVGAGVGTGVGCAVMLGKGSGVGAGLESMQPVSANIIRADSTM